MKRRIYVGIGSNDDAARNVPAAMRLLRTRAEVVAASAVYETEALGEAAGSAPYLNGVVAVETELTPDQLKERILMDIERQLLRSRDTPGRVAIDLDVLLWENAAGGDAAWACMPENLSHPHVAVPLADVAPEVLHPATLKPLREVAALCRTMSGVRPRADLHL